MSKQLRSMRMHSQEQFTSQPVFFLFSFLISSTNGKKINGGRFKNEMDYEI